MDNSYKSNQNGMPDDQDEDAVNNFQQQSDATVDSDEDGGDQAQPQQPLSSDDDESTDESTPFSPPDDIESNRPDTHPQTDTNVDPDEAYQEGLDTATNSDSK